MLNDEYAKNGFVSRETILMIKPEQIPIQSVSRETLRSKNLVKKNSS